MPIILDGTAGIDNDATDLSYTGTLTGGTGVVNLGSGQVYKDASGNVGIGTSSPAFTFGKGLMINNAGFSTLRLNNSSASVNSEISSHSTGLLQYTLTNHPVVFGTNGTEKARIDSSGNLLVGTTSYVSGEARLTVVNKAGNTNNPVVNLKANATTIATTMLGFYDGTDAFCGQAYIDPNSNTTVFATSSDYRLKQNVAPMTGALERVSLLKPCTYTWKKSGRVGEGFIAHELAEVCPAAVVGEKDAVTENGDINPQMIDTSFLVATLTAAIQELKAINDAQAQTIESLTARVAALEQA